MEIREQQWEEEKLKVNETEFPKSRISMDPLEEDPTSSILDPLDSLKIPFSVQEGQSSLWSSWWSSL